MIAHERQQHQTTNLRSQRGSRSQTTSMHLTGKVNVPPANQISNQNSNTRGTFQNQMRGSFSNLATLVHATTQPKRGKSSSQAQAAENNVIATQNTHPNAAPSGSQSHRTRSAALTISSIVVAPQPVLLPPQRKDFRRHPTPTSLKTTATNQPFEIKSVTPRRSVQHLNQQMSTGQQEFQRKPQQWPQVNSNHIQMKHEKSTKPTQQHFNRSNSQQALRHQQQIPKQNQQVGIHPQLVPASSHSGVSSIQIESKLMDKNVRSSQNSISGGGLAQFSRNNVQRRSLNIGDEKNSRMPDPVKPLKSRKLKNIVNPYGGLDRNKDHSSSKNAMTTSQTNSKQNQMQQEQEAQITARARTVLNLNSATNLINNNNTPSCSRNGTNNQLFIHPDLNAALTPTQKQASSSYRIQKQASQRSSGLHQQSQEHQPVNHNHHYSKVVAKQSSLHDKIIQKQQVRSARKQSGNQRTSGQKNAPQITKLAPSLPPSAIMVIRDARGGFPAANLAQSLSIKQSLSVTALSQQTQDTILSARGGRTYVPLHSQNTIQKAPQTSKVNQNGPVTQRQQIKRVQKQGGVIAVSQQVKNNGISPDGKKYQGNGIQKDTGNFRVRLLQNSKTKLSPSNSLTTNLDQQNQNFQEQTAAEFGATKNSVAQYSQNSYFNQWPPKGTQNKNFSKQPNSQHKQISLNSRKTSTGMALSSSSSVRKQIQDKIKNQIVKLVKAKRDVQKGHGEGNIQRKLSARKNSHKQKNQTYEQGGTTSSYGGIVTEYTPQVSGMQLSEQSKETQQSQQSSSQKGINESSTGGSKLNVQRSLQIRTQNVEKQENSNVFVTSEKNLDRKAIENHSNSSNAYDKNIFQFTPNKESASVRTFKGPITLKQKPRSRNNNDGGTTSSYLSTIKGKAREQEQQSLQNIQTYRGTAAAAPLQQLQQYQTDSDGTKQGGFSAASVFSISRSMTDKNSSKAKESSSCVEQESKDYFFVPQKQVSQNQQKRQYQLQQPLINSNSQKPAQIAKNSNEIIQPLQAAPQLNLNLPANYKEEEKETAVKGTLGPSRESTKNFVLNQSAGSLEQQNQQAQHSDKDNMRSSGVGGAFAQKVVEQLSKKRDLPLDNDIYGLEQSAATYSASNNLISQGGPMMKHANFTQQNQNPNMTTPSMQTIEHHTLTLENTQTSNPQNLQNQPHSSQQLLLKHLKARNEENCVTGAVDSQSLYLEVVKQLSKDSYGAGPIPISKEVLELLSKQQEHISRQERQLQEFRDKYSQQEIEVNNKTEQKEVQSTIQRSETGAPQEMTLAQVQNSSKTLVRDTNSLQKNQQYSTIQTIASDFNQNVLSSPDQRQKQTLAFPYQPPPTASTRLQDIESQSKIIVVNTPPPAQAMYEADAESAEQMTTSEVQNASEIGPNLSQLEMSSIAFADSQSSPLENIDEFQQVDKKEDLSDKNGEKVKIFEDTIEIELQDIINQMQQ